MKKVLLILLMCVILVALLSSVAFAADGEPVEASQGEAVVAAEVEPVAAPGQVDAGVIAVVLFMAIVVEMVIERMKDIIGRDKKVPPWILNVLAVVIGVGLCVWFNVNMFAAFGVSSIYVAGNMAGVIVTGFMIGGGSGFMHTVIDRLKLDKGAVLEPVKEWVEPMKKE